jgi:hypothetical protein
MQFIITYKIAATKRPRTQDNNENNKSDINVVPVKKSLNPFKKNEGNGKSGTKEGNSLFGTLKGMKSPIKK